jgi:hypothetical protein
MVLGEQHPETLTSMKNLALIYQDQRTSQDAADVRENVLSTLRSSYVSSAHHVPSHIDVPT